MAMNQQLLLPNSMRAKGKRKRVHGLNLEVERLSRQKMQESQEERNPNTAYPLHLLRHRCLFAIAKINPTGSRKAWESPRAP